MASIRHSALLKTGIRWLAALALLQALAGCQYASFVYKVTDSDWAGTNNSPEADCEAMGATRGTALLDWCTSSLEDRLDRERRDYNYYASQ